LLSIGLVASAATTSATSAATATTATPAAAGTSVARVAAMAPVTSITRMIPVIVGAVVMTAHIAMLDQTVIVCIAATTVPSVDEHGRRRPAACQVGGREPVVAVIAVKLLGVLHRTVESFGAGLEAGVVIDVLADERFGERAVGGTVQYVFMPDGVCPLGGDHVFPAAHGLIDPDQQQELAVFLLRYLRFGSNERLSYGDGSGDRLLEVETLD
jgi:hypothetical protein